MKRIGSNDSHLSNGYVLYEDNAIVVIATGITKHSTNRKTGSMIQVYILYRWISPVEAIKAGLDSTICLDCIHRGTDGFAQRSCYVNMQGPLSVWAAYQRGSYPQLAAEDYPRVFRDRAVRLGTYGEPSLIPLPIVRALCVLSRRHSGYTHQWGRIDPEYNRYLMASVDRVGDASIAHALGWRTFRVATQHDQLASEVICPSESKGRHCADCTLCTGSTSQGKSVVITVHGSGQKHLQTKLDRLIQIGGAA